MLTKVHPTNLIVGSALIVVGSLFFTGSVLLNLGCGPGSLLVQSACDEMRRAQFFQLWFEGASFFAVALTVLFAGRMKMSLRRILALSTNLYGLVPFLLFLVMLVTGLPGSPYSIQVILLYYLLPGLVGLITVVSRADALSRPHVLAKTPHQQRPSDMLQWSNSA